MSTFWHIKDTHWLNFFNSLIYFVCLYVKSIALLFPAATNWCGITNVERNLHVISLLYRKKLRPRDIKGLFHFYIISVRTKVKPKVTGESVNYFFLLWCIVPSFEFCFSSWENKSLWKWNAPFLHFILAKLNFSYITGTFLFLTKIPTRLTLSYFWHVVFVCSLCLWCLAKCTACSKY